MKPATAKKQLLQDGHSPMPLDEWRLNVLHQPRRAAADRGSLSESALAKVEGGRRVIKPYTWPAYMRAYMIQTESFFDACQRLSEEKASKK